MALKINSASGSITLTAEDGSGNADVTIPRDGIVSDLSDLSITATAAEINTLDGVTATTAELNHVDGVTSNIQTQLDAKGTVSSLADLSVTATATELNLLDGVTATTTELNYVDGVTSNIQTQLDAKGTVSTLADLSITATSTELNYVDGVTSNIQTQLDAKGTVSTLADLSVTASAAELNLLDGVTATTTELNYVDGVTSAIQTQIDGKLATSLKGAASGLAELDGSGLVPTSQLPSYVDDVLEYTNASSFPATGTAGKIYVALDTNDIYRWSGSAYVKVSDAVSTSDQATALATARTIALTGDVTGSTSFDGSANVSITATIADDSHNHVISNVDGLQTALDGKLASSSYTAADVLTKIKTVDGSGSGLDADLWDGNQFSSYLNQAVLTTSSPTFNNSYLDGAIYHNGDPDTYIQFDAADSFRIITGNGQRLKADSSGVKLGDAGNGYFQPVSGDYGSIQIDGGAHSGWEGYSIGGRAVFMHDNASDIYLYDDVNTAACFRATFGGSSQLYYAGTSQLQTTSNGVNISGKMTSTSAIINGSLDIEEVFEKVSTNTTTSGTYSEAITGGGVYYLTNNQTANRTINFTGVNSALSNGQSVTVTVLSTQGSTAYYFNAYQVDSSAVTPKWSGGSAPTAGNASGIDVYTFTIIKTANATFTVLASVTQYA